MAQRLNPFRLLEEDRVHKSRVFEEGEPLLHEGIANAVGLTLRHGRYRRGRAGVARYGAHSVLRGHHVDQRLARSGPREGAEWHSGSSPRPEPRLASGKIQVGEVLTHAIDEPHESPIVARVAGPWIAG